MDNDNIDSIFRDFNVTVLSIPIVYDFFGDHDPDGIMYILKEYKDEVKNKALVNFYNKDEKGLPLPRPTEEVQPLTIRANVGDTIRIEFEHNEERRLSIHMQGLKYKNILSDGANAGYNVDSTVGPGEKITYEWYADREGIFYFSDMGDTRFSEKGTNIHGLFGALIVQAKGASWTDPVDGNELKSGIFADIHNPSKPSFREYAVYFHDELEAVNRFGKPIIDPHTGMRTSVTAISYRSEPMVNRAAFIPDKDVGFKFCNPCNPKDNINIIDIKKPMEHHVVDGEDVSMSSWTYGDPATFIPRAYKGDPSKFRLIHGGVQETHVFHLHTHQWRLEPDNPDSTIIDSISVGPQESYTLDILYGAGSLVGSIGDHIWHCHLYPHFHEGMWSLWRVFDRLETGENVVLENGQVISPLYPDGTIIKELKPLPDRTPPPAKDLDHPGYPNFINGKFRERPKQPPLGIINQKGGNKICPTELESDNFADNFTKGALYTQPCSNKKDKCGCKKADVIFELFVLQAKLVYNKSGWNDPYGRFYVTKEQIEEYTECKVTNENKEELAKRYLAGVENRCIDVEPLVIRANKGDCIEVRTTNFLPEMLPKTAFQLETLTDNVGFHIHLVKFDVIASDGGANGYNNIASVFYGETLVERYYANEELNACFFHDHFNPNSHQQHGVFGEVIIEPKGSKYYDPKTGKRIKYGTKAVIETPSGRKFREFGLFVHDFALLFDKKGNPLNKPPFPGSHDDPGVMGINYKCEPLRERLTKEKLNGEDSAYVFSSRIHDDPVTPILETYPGDEIVIRLLDGAQEEQHAFNINGMKWRKEITDIRSPLVQAQTIGISEVFNIRIKDDYEGGDYLYYFGGQDDLWLGLWGIIRAYKNKTKNLLPINSSEECSNKIDDSKEKKVREFHIAAIQKDILYNCFEDHDPDGLLFVPYKYKDDILSGKMEPKPLILRANKGEYIKVKLTNCFTKPIPYQVFPGVPVDKVVTPSMRVGISPQFLGFNPIADSGVNVGYNNLEQTVKPGDSKTYLWYADEEYGTCLLSSFTDIRNHRYHGLFGAIIIEPEEAQIENDDIYGDQATISEDGRNAFREFVIFMHNGIRLLDVDGNLIETNREIGEDGQPEPVDFEDRGEKGFNYRSERFFNRLGDNPDASDIANVFSSVVHEDPATPIFEASPGERVIIRLLMPADKPRNTCFVLHGHKWKAQPDDPFTNIISAQGAMSVGNVFNIELINGASMIPGDYLYRSGVIKWDIESGMWGIFRIKDQNTPDL
ncbi:manganese oxidase [Clostridium neonatale]|uniref:multicopper oxidase domain-containing protein n=1 Tax=Clostridium neonatale TaxID=137838 RepID=UPI00291B74AB|nr:manganese oxidase [Clostridium neonatale]CAI3631524.1 manganese oxidase [Clostridium neonatale]CAI3648030.1 manganese oxidase [Clostridium neonatale]CAI3670430.1 manganese oxidase [Clostridium neonatale]CAI3681318.1 manganese oxidase [Clostridium neonatale]